MSRSLGWPAALVLLRRLWRDIGANYTIAFALLGSALVVTGGGTIDLMRHLEARSRLHDAVDATALLVAARYQSGETPATGITALAREVLAQTYVDDHATITEVVGTADTASLTVSASAGLETVFLQIVGIPSISSSATATIAWSTTSIEVALVLDTTGSMADSDKIGQMKTAASAMVDSIFAKAGSSATVRFSVVPFSHFVNVGSGYASAAWIDHGGTPRSSYYDTYFNTHIDRLAVYTALGKTWKGCVETRPAPWDVDDTAPNSAIPDTLFVPAFHPDEPDTHSPYYGNSYLGDKTFFGDDWTRTINAAKYTSPVGINFSNSTLYSNYLVPKGPEFLCASQPLLRLTATAATVKAKIASLTPAGGTNIPEGLAWGWRTLSPKGPFADGRAYSDTDNRKVVVLLTDGANALNTFPTALGGAYSSWGFPVSGRVGANPGVDLRDGLDAKTRSICTKLKSAGAKIYTIGLMITDALAQQVLAECSSGSGYHYDSPSAVELQAIFDDIAKKISKIRIAS